eukprot:CAMPEP_0119277128 /NCGR_PEP_ID=MMETSP1329-20130426/16637_1 /TAXON_ID=114041 /ORGANISM="Genus nov. species nov., Strain RCC1024" /LENGTH=36 /DNA_ID= /DNA_START= /DNA_END= /DNA_ORIENTATION=
MTPGKIVGGVLLVVVVINVCLVDLLLYNKSHESHAE